MSFKLCNLRKGHRWFISILLPDLSYHICSLFLHGFRRRNKLTLNLFWLLDFPHFDFRDRFLKFSFVLFLRFRIFLNLILVLQNFQFLLNIFYLCDSLIDLQLDKIFRTLPLITFFLNLQTLIVSIFNLFFLFMVSNDFIPWKIKFLFFIHFHPGSFDLYSNLLIHFLETTAHLHC